MYAKIIFTTAFLTATGASALDWTQPILDENDNRVADCPVDATTKLMQACPKVLTLGTIAARALLVPEERGSVMPADQKALLGNLALDILHHMDLVPTPEQLKAVKDAIGKAMPPLAVARANALLDAAVK